MNNPENLSISAVAHLTGIAKEVLRKWETRYGFPVPARDAGGNRVYPAAQANRLKTIKKLIDDGMRPSQVVPLDENQLAALASGRQAQAAMPSAPPAAELIGWLQARDPALLQEKLRAQLAQSGLRTFVMERMAAMNEHVGQAWASGAIAVRDEHLYTEIMQVLLREALAQAARPAGTPRILLTTAPGEAHALGILMAETVLALEGADCISLGAQSPLEEIVMAARDYRARVVALSFSLAFPKRKIVPLLKTLRAALPAEIQLWAGGAGVTGLDSTPRGVALLPTLGDGVAALEKYRQRLAAGAA